MAENDAAGDELHPYGAGSHGPLQDEREMPTCHPIKGRVREDGTKLYHRPDGRDYESTIAEVWFDSPSAAEAAGFVLAPTHPPGSVGADFEPGASGHPCSAEMVDAARAAAAGLAGTVGDGDGDGDGAGAGDGEEPASPAPGQVAATGAAAGAAGAAAIGAAGAASAAADAAGGELVGDTASAAADGTSAVAASAAETVEDVAPGGAGLGTAAPGATGAAALASQHVGAAASGMASDASGAVGRAAGGGDGDSGRGLGSPATGGGLADRSGLGRWLWLGIGLLGLVVLLGLLLSQCGSDDEENEAGTADTEAVDPAAPGSADDPAPTIEPADDAAATDDAGTGAEDAVTTTAGSDGADLEALALAALADAGYDGVGVEVDGDTVRLTGELGSQDERAAAEAAVAGVAGVGGVTNEITVAAAAADSGSDPDETPTAEATDGDPSYTG